VLKSAVYPYNTINDKDFLVKNFGLRFHFNGQETDDEIAGKGNINTAEYWEYDTRLGRRWNRDPIIKHHLSSYETFGNNPIVNIDINGDNEGKYYDKDGVEIGDDQQDDGKEYIVADKKEATTISNDTKNGKNPIKGLVVSALEVPNKEVRNAMQDAIYKSTKPNNTAQNLPGEDPFGGFHEEGGVWGLGYGEGQSAKAIPAKSGAYCDPEKDKKAVVNTLIPADANGASLATINGMYHVHPSGVKFADYTGAGSVNVNNHFVQTPTDPDDFAAHTKIDPNNKSYSIVFGARNGNTYLFNGDKILLIMKTSVFMNIGIKK